MDDGRANDRRTRSPVVSHRAGDKQDARPAKTQPRTQRYPRTHAHAHARANTQTDRQDRQTEMPKNKGKGGKNVKRGKNQKFEEARELVYKEDGQECVAAMCCVL